ncbi:hypothetical protein K1719_038846 [Acacia pycnantha]|nr:hypothetical protein K1719_038846 [Acacia pycnantha]
MLGRVVSKIEHLQAASGLQGSREGALFSKNMSEEWFQDRPRCSVRGRTHWSWTQLPLPSTVTASYGHSTTLERSIKANLSVIVSSMNLKVENNERQSRALICDASCIQAILKRLHWEKFLAEAKFQRSPNSFRQAVEAQDLQLLNDALMCHEHRDTAAKIYVDMENATGDKKLALAANVCLYLVLPFADFS